MPGSRISHTSIGHVKVLTLGGSIRRRIGSLEMLIGDGNSSTSGGSARAKENTYSFV